MSVSALRAILDRHGLALHRDRGQNFLIDAAGAEALAVRAGVGEGDAVLEVGTGLGVLTRALAARGARVTTIEIDAGLVRALRAEALLPGDVELVHADALSLDWAELAARAGARRAPGAGLRVVANLPYSVATPLLRRWLDLRGVLSDWSVMVQRELALRLQARVGEGDYGSLAVLHAWCVEVESLRDLSPGCFFPAPRVSSRFLRLRPRAESPVAGEDLAPLERVVRAAFRTRRKMLQNALRAAGLAAPAEAFSKAGVDPRVRAEQLGPEALLALARILAAAGP